ncbi:MAG: M48 family metallopeptidase [Candidatus Poribacteria bacterium]|nr:M48 family metallopeptidase [Candidatus Poribacteria bacterium]MDE0503088.1 M48 family metallopeptidase [Candidatus Poribacteria bacterium]
MNPYLVIILAALIGEFLLRSFARYLNLKALSPNLPSEFVGFYDEEKYRRSQEYSRANTKFAYVSSTFDLILMVGFILMGGFNFIDGLARDWTSMPILRGFVFFGLLYVLRDVLSTPFALYETFVIEERFGFNKTTAKTFLLDKVKSYILVAVLGAILLGGILYFFGETGDWGWLYAWGLVSAFIIVAPSLFVTVIAPLFNKFTPLSDGPLRDAIEEYSESVKFPLTEISVMDGSKRSGHSNAYFSGFGKKKRIVLFDTLMEKHSEEELVAILAHEVGHYKRKHILKGMLISIAHAGILFYLLSLFIENRGLFDAFRMDQLSVYAGLVFFGILYSPIELVLSIVMNIVSRQHEYEADAFAADTIGSPEPLVSGLKTLSVSNLGNLTPDDLTVILNYSHPPMLQRIAALRALGIAAQRA